MRPSSVLPLLVQALPLCIPRFDSNPVLLVCVLTVDRLSHLVAQSVYVREKYTKTWVKRLEKEGENWGVGTINRN